MKTRLFAKHLIPNKIAAGLFIAIAILSIKYCPSAAALPVFFAAIIGPALFFAKSNYINLGGQDDN